jgi:import inner membrane translocase subunit TIM17
MSSIKARAPVTGGNFGIFGGMFMTFDCVVKGYRQKEDAWNSIISGFMTGGCLAARSSCFCSQEKLEPSLISFLGGPRASLQMAVASGILLGVFEGIGVLMNRMFSENTRAQLPPPRMYHQPSTACSITYASLAPDAPPASVMASIPAHA